MATETTPVCALCGEALTPENAERTEKYLDYPLCITHEHTETRRRAYEQKRRFIAHYGRRAA